MLRKGQGPGSRVGFMISIPMKTQFEAVLEAQHLSDAVSTFADPDFCDEIPLYSRYKQVAFLKKHGDVDLVLIELAIDYLNRVTSALNVGRNRRLIAITVISDADDESIVPYIFVCNGSVKARLKNLRLSPPSDGLGKRIKTLVQRANMQAAFSVFEDRSTVADDVRVFIGHKSPPLGLVNLETFVDRQVTNKAD